MGVPFIPHILAPILILKVPHALLSYLDLAVMDSHLPLESLFVGDVSGGSGAGLNACHRNKCASCM